MMKLWCSVVVILIVYIQNVSSIIVWKKSMNNFEIDENKDLGVHVYNLSAVREPGGSSEGIQYGFSDGLSGAGMVQIDDFFRIEKDSGFVFTYGNKLDYEAGSSRDFKIDLIAKTADGLEYSIQTSSLVVRDTNDNEPKFANGSLIVQIPENTEVGEDGLIALENIYITDVDTFISAPQRFLNASIQYCIINGEPTECSDFFELVHVGDWSSKFFRANFIIKQPLDFEAASKIQVQLLAVDGNPANSITTDVVVNVINMQDLPPKWIFAPHTSKTKDQTAVGKLNITIKAEDQDTPQREVEYSFQIGQYVDGINIEDVFVINKTSGLITNLVVLDLEDKTFRDYGSKKIRFQWPLIVQACEVTQKSPRVVGNTSTECVKPTTVNVIIEDINDNKPTFNRESYEYTIREDIPSGTALLQPEIEITDRDGEIFAKFENSFLTPSDEFFILGINRNPTIVVTDTNLIDYENGPQVYNLIMITKDLMNEEFFSTANITIYVTDFNDNDPSFPVPEYYASIPEDSEELYEVVLVKATDRDSGDFGSDSIRYYLTGSYSYLFNIKEETGLMTVAKCDEYGVAPCLDYDKEPISYEVYVTAIDSYGVGLESSIPVTVNVTAVNDNKPTVPDYDRYITEGMTRFSPPLNVQGKDVDGDVLYYSIFSQFPNDIWQIDSRSGEITVDKGGAGVRFSDGTDLGTGGSSFELEVVVSDLKYEAISYVFIRVIDINDNPPIFFPTLYETTIDETIPPGSFVLDVTATDADDSTSENGKINYIIQSGNIGGRFNLNISTGRITVSQGATFDYDIQRIYTMNITAQDNGQPQLSGNATVIVYIRDTNNKDPYIDPSLQEFTVYDNSPPGFFVGTIGAGDPDDNAVLKFQWGDFREANSDEGYPVDPVNGFDFRDLFIVDPDTGKIYVDKPLNSRLANLVRYSVIVTDITPTPVQDGFGTVVFKILPFNDEPPRFEPYDSPIYLDEEQAIGSGVISLMAQDDNGIRLFELVKQPDDKFFAISQTTGSVSILNRIDYDDARMINDSYFIVTVTDTGDPTLTATASVSVIFRNINDNFPQFVERNNYDRPKNIYTARIEENSPDGTPVVTVFAVDFDRPDNNSFHEVRYYMNDDRFDVDPLTGEIYVRLRNGAFLDREINPRINTQVIARDNPNGNRTEQNQRVATVLVILTDVNDNAPKFSRKEYYVQIFETMRVDYDIIQLFSTDRDIGENARSYYYKIPDIGTDTQDFFDVRKEKGRVYLKKSVLYNVGTYVFYVEAVNLFSTTLKSNATVIVEVLPAANSPPVWVKPPIDNMTIYVLEEQYNGMLVYDVSARDLDSGVNGIVDYSFIYDGHSTQRTPEFRINKATGVIHAEIVYDRENVNQYVLLLNASDRGDTRLGTTRFLTVVILDVNDNPPIFAESEIEIRVAENRPLGEIQRIPAASDADQNPLILYHIISGNEDKTFALDPETRVLSLMKPLDREIQSIYYIDVQASNDEPDYTVIRNRKKRATDPSIITLKILVGDINDEAPRFLQDEYYGCVSARAPFEKHILTVQAIDSDAIGTGVVRYLLTDGHTVGNTTLFGIHEKYGILTNRVLMRKYTDSTFFVTVNARDREDVNTAESANTVAKIFVNQPGNEVKLLITQNTGEVRLYQSQIQSILEQSEGLDYVCINEVRDHVVNSAGAVSTLWSDVFATGIRKTVVNGQVRHKILTSTEFVNIINTERYARKSDFDLLYIREVEAASSSQEIELEDQAVLIILIIIAILIFLVIIFCILAFMCIRAAKRHKKELLLHKTHATPPPMVAQEPVVVEPIIYDNRMFVQEEQPPVQVVEEQTIVEHDPVHVQYAVVQKRSPSPQIVEQSVHQYVEDDQDAIVVELKADEPQPQSVVYEVDPEYRIETELVQETERF